MKKIIIFFCLYFISCTKSEPLKNYDAAYFLAEWQRQYSSWGYDKDSCCYNSIDSTFFINCQDRGIFCFEGHYFYCGFTCGAVFEYKQKYYMWGNDDLFEPLFWRIKPNTAPYNSPICRINPSLKIDSTKHFFTLRTWSKTQEMWEVYLPAGYNGGKLFFNDIFFAETQKEGGEIFDISNYGQFSQLNELLRDNPKYHKPKNLLKIDSLLFGLQDWPRVFDEETIPHTHIRIDINAKKLFPNHKIIANDTIVQKRGVDFLESSLVYFDGVETVFNKKYDTHGSEEYKDSRTYKGYHQKKDSLNILHDYLRIQKPTFLYYKAAAHPQSLWYNYFLAFYVTYDEYNIPQITKVDLICPNRVFFFLCYPYSICGDSNTRSLFNSIRSDKYREISRKQQTMGK